MNILRRLPLWRLLLACAVVLAIGVSASALALALGSGPVPPEKPLAVAVHDALAAPAVEGVSANIQLTDHLLEGINLSSGEGEAGQLSANPLISGAAGRLWIAKDGRMRLELQSEKGDTQIVSDGHTVSLYDAATNTLYRYTLPQEHEAGAQPDSGGEVPSVAKIEEAISHAGKHADISGATPTDVAGQAAYTVRVAPKESGSLFAGAELSFDAAHGVPLRAAIYSTTTSAPVIELAATSVSYGPVEDSVFELSPPPGVKVEEISAPKSSAAARARHRRRHAASHADSATGEHPSLKTAGSGIASIAVLESHVKAGSKSALPEELPKVKINGVSATELATPLGTLLEFERSGVRYLLAGSVTPAAIEAVARGL